MNNKILQTPVFMILQFSLINVLSIGIQDKVQNDIGNTYIFQETLRLQTLRASVYPKKKSFLHTVV